METKREKWVALYAAVITFLTYAAVYAFRKPFTVGTFEHEKNVLGLHYKDALVICQVLGYMASKFYGIRFIAELKRIGRGKTILLLVGISWLALLLFALLPAPFNIVCLFLNGFPLGMIWGIVFSFVEGRKTTDFIGASLAVSFIFSSGLVKTIAKWLMVYGNINEYWIPFVTGLLFMLPMILLVFLLEKIPPPSADDANSRVARLPMNKEERKQFFNQFKTGLVLLIIVYVFLTIFRDIRDNFAADMWQELGFGNQPEVFTTTEVPTTILVLILISCMMLIENNRRAFVLTHLIVILGFFMAGASSLLFVTNHLSPFVWMTLAGLGLYIGYIPFNCILFDRMIASFKCAGNVGFLMYLADSFGYMGSVGVIMLKAVFNLKLKWTAIYSNGVVVLSVMGIALTLLALAYFNKKYQTIVNEHE